MRTLLTILTAITLLSAKAQSHLPISPWGLGLGYTQWQPLPFYDNLNNAQKWQLRPYASLSAGYVFLNGGISYLSAPIGLNLYHPLNKNVTAFAGLVANPVIFNAAGVYGNPLTQPWSGNNFSNGYGYGINAGVQGGLIYTNDAHTFSISGSVIMQRGSYPVYPASRTTPVK